MKNKLFYFLSYEGTLDRETAARFTTVPTAAMKRGDMSGSTTPIYDPATGDTLGAGRTVFAGNQVPVSRTSSISRKIVDLMPAPSLSDLTNNYYATAPFKFDRHNVDTKVDWNPTQKLTAFGRFGMLHYETFNPQVFGDALGGPPTSGLGGNPGTGEGYTKNLTLGATYILTPSFIVDAHFGYTKQDTNSQQPRLNEQVGLDILKIPGPMDPAS